MNRNLLFAALLLVTGNFFALAEDPNQPITIKAARVEIDQKKGMSTYEGGVELQQGSLAISATRIVVHHKNNEVSRIEAEGAPVKIRLRPAGNEGFTHAQGREYRRYYCYHAIPAMASVSGS